MTNVLTNVVNYASEVDVLVKKEKDVEVLAS
jgi:hypothetical protein